jgi:hypothetical protein
VHVYCLYYRVEHAEKLSKARSAARILEQAKLMQSLENYTMKASEGTIFIGSSREQQEGQGEGLSLYHTCVKCVPVVIYSVMCHSQLIWSSVNELV